MCGRYSLFTPMDALVELFDLEVVPAHDPLGLLAPRYNIAPTQQVAIIRPTPGQRRRLDLVRWGLVPAWRKSPSDGPLCINARAESVADKPSFREAFATRRCLVPANGFYEWREVGGGKQPYFIHTPGAATVAFAGLWERWTDGRDTLESCSIVTTAANEVVQPIHPRMPAILRPADWGGWLDEAATTTELERLLRPADPILIIARPVSRAVNHADREGADLLDPVDPNAPPEPSPADPRDRQLSLF